MDAFSHENKKVIWITPLKGYNIINSTHITYHPTSQSSGSLPVAAEFGVITENTKVGQIPYLCGIILERDCREVKIWKQN